jgi:hypothetical protein
MTLRRALLLTLGIVLLLTSAYCALWIASSASLAGPACNFRFSLFAESFRCRQPYVASILAVVLAGGAIWLIVLGLRRQGPGARI